MRSPSPTPTAEAYLPLKPVVFHILLALAEGEAHGYAVILTVRERSQGRIRLESGSFYRHLRKLLAEGLVEEGAPASSADDPRRGAYYRLTDLARDVLRAESRRLQELVALTGDLGLLSPDGSS